MSRPPLAGADEGVPTAAPGASDASARRSQGGSGPRRVPILPVGAPTYRRFPAGARATPEAAGGAPLQLRPARLLPLSAEGEAKAVALLASLIGDRLNGRLAGPHRP